MYTIRKTLNHNSVIAVCDENQQECLLMDKGIGFGKKMGDHVTPADSCTIYSLKASTERGDAAELANSINPIYLEIADEILDEAARVFQNIDRSVLFPMADHMEFAVKRIQNHEEISNPLTDDIRVLFHMEYKAAMCAYPILKKRFGIEVSEDEIGYIALHIHSAIQDEKVSQAMQIARAVRECISLVEQNTGHPIDVMTLSYNRLMNHTRNMIARVMQGEKLKLNMNDYMSVKFPEAFETAAHICEQIGRSLKCQLNDVEIGYLAMHIERVTNGELDSTDEA